MANIGFINNELDLDSQVDKLNKIGCDKIFQLNKFSADGIKLSLEEEDKLFIPQKDSSPESQNKVKEVMDIFNTEGVVFYPNAEVTHSSIFIITVSFVISSERANPSFPFEELRSQLD